LKAVEVAHYLYSWFGDCHTRVSYLNHSGKSRDPKSGWDQL